jgi:hypothetical protein
MAFVGQLYAKDWWPLDGHLALQIYVCDGCRHPARPPKKGFTLGRDFGGVPNAIHLEFLPTTAPTNTKAIGVRCRFQPKRYISYTPVEDSMDQWEFNRRELPEEELADKHLRLDKLGGLFPYDSEGTKITKQNMMIGQLGWQHWQGFGFGGTVYLYRSARVGIYPLLYS